MAVTQTVKRFAQQVLTTSSATLYTCPASTVANIRDVQVCNITASSQTYTMYIVASGDSPAAKNTIIGTRTLVGSGTDVHTDVYRFNAILTAGDTLRALAGTNNAVVVQASGIESVGTFLKTTPKRLAQADLTNSSATLYTVPASTKAILKDLTVCNYSSSNDTFTVDVVLSGGSVGNASKMFYTYYLAANSTASFRLSAVMETGDTFRALAASNGRISLNLSGVEVT